MKASWAPLASDDVSPLKASQVEVIEHAIEASTALPSDDGSDLDASVAEVVNDTLEQADGNDATSLLGAAICRNASFLENLPALSEAHRAQLLDFELAPEELEARLRSLDTINEEVATVTGVGVEVYKQTLHMANARRKDLTVLQTFKRKADKAPDDKLPELAGQAIAKLKVSQVKSAELMPALHNFRMAAAKLQRMCDEESKAQQAIVDSKQEQQVELQRQIEEGQRTLDTDSAYLNSGQADQDLDKARELKKEMVAHLEYLRQKKRDLQDWYATRNRLCQVGAVAGVCAAGAVAVGCAVVTGLAIAALGPFSIAAMIVGAAAGAAAVAVVGTVVVSGAVMSGLLDEESQQEDLVRQAEAQEARVQEAEARVQQAQRKNQELRDKWTAFQDEIQRLSQRKEMLEKHKATLGELQDTLKKMATNLKESDKHSNDILTLLEFFDAKAAAAIEAGEGEDEDEIRAYIEFNLRSDLFQQWAENLDLLEASNHRLLQAVHKLNAPRA